MPTESGHSFRCYTNSVDQLPDCRNGNLASRLSLTERNTPNRASHLLSKEQQDFVIVWWSRDSTLHNSAVRQTDGPNAHKRTLLHRSYREESNLHSSFPKENCLLQSRSIHLYKVHP